MGRQGAWSGQAWSWRVALIFGFLRCHPSSWRSGSPGRTEKPGEWPPLLPTVVLMEALSGDHRRDYHENRLLRTCDLRAVCETLAGEAAALRAQVQTRRVAPAVDAIVIAVADQVGGGIVLSRDPSGPTRAGSTCAQPRPDRVGIEPLRRSARERTRSRPSVDGRIMSTRRGSSTRQASGAGAPSVVGQTMHTLERNEFGEPT